MPSEELCERSRIEAEPEKITLSVIIPAYQAERTIKRAVSSVVSCPDSRLEVVVVDDGSSDATAKIVRALAAADRRIRLVRQANAGRSAARNRGIAESHGKRIMFLDADDHLLDGAMFHVMDFCEDPHSLVVFPAIISTTPRYIGYSHTAVAVAAACERLEVCADEFMRWMIYSNPDELCGGLDLTRFEINAVWARLYSRECIDDSVIAAFGGAFPVGMRRSEDRLFNLAYLKSMGREDVVFDSLPVYYWDLGESKTVAVPSERDALDMPFFCESVKEMVKAEVVSPDEATAICSKEFFHRFVSSVPANYASTEERKCLWVDIYNECAGPLNPSQLVLPAKGMRWAITRSLLKFGQIGAAFQFEVLLRTIKRKFLAIARATAPSE